MEIVKKRLIVDISSLNDCAGHITGIPRTVAEYSKRLIKDFDPIFIAYNYIKCDYFIVNKEKLSLYLDSYDQIHKNFLTNHRFSFKNYYKKSVFLDLGPVESSFKRSSLYHLLHNHQIYIVSFIYDMLPLTLNVFEHTDASIFNFLNFYSAAFKFSDMLITISNSQKNQILHFLNSCNIKKDVNVIKLGCDLKTNFSLSNINKHIIETARNKFILIIGTLSPRKNHNVSIDAFSNYLYKNTNLNLIIAGRIGWKSEKLVEKISKSDLYNKRIFLLDSPNNDEIIYLYKHAFCTVMGSFDEGYGLPVIESMYYGCLTFCSDIGVFHEISNCNVFFNPNDPKDLSNKIKAFYNNKSLYRNKAKQLSKFKHTTWDASYQNLLELTKLKQLAY